ncbi:hypothetical protein [Psychroserpens luteolus]|uniref:hypothetical protein n=1 Tax=Psychroserpens luteolus TaxID=2855840 RepID=UPI001E46E28B|nr:hypothetical protein [Psychroserpens luteolus]MCD2258774.1 hypothetical protein [Psychroserpens luteolus]
MKSIIFKGFAALLIIVLLRIPLAEINNHTYTVGVSNTYGFTGCINYDDLITPVNFKEIKDSNLN